MKELLQAREIRALKISLIARILVLLVATNFTLTIGKSVPEKVVTATIALTGP